MKLLFSSRCMRMFLSSRHQILSDSCMRGPSSQSSGFSLIELLVATVLLSVAGAVAWTALEPQLRFPVQFERATRQIDDTSRLQNLLESEVSEASGIVYGQTLQSGCGSLGTGTALFSLVVPYSFDLSNGLPLNVVTDYYSTPGQRVIRCGMGVNSDGSLDYNSTPIPVVVATGIEINLTEATNSKYLGYRFTGGALRPSVDVGIHAATGVVR